MGCLSSKTNNIANRDKEREEFGFDQTYRKSNSHVNIQEKRQHSQTSLPRSIQPQASQSRTALQQASQHRADPPQGIIPRAISRSGGGGSQFDASTVDRSIQNIYGRGAVDPGLYKNNKADSYNGSQEANGSDRRSNNQSIGNSRVNGRGHEVARSLERRNVGQRVEDGVGGGSRGHEKSGGDAFSRNQFDRASQLRKSKKKRKKSSDTTLSPGSGSIASPSSHSLAPSSLMSPSSHMSPGTPTSVTSPSHQNLKITPSRVEGPKSSSPQSPKTAASITAEMEQESPNKTDEAYINSRTEYDPKYGNLI